jgi:hypothetical protein
MPSWRWQAASAISNAAGMISFGLILLDQGRILYATMSTDE